MLLHTRKVICDISENVWYQVGKKLELEQGLPASNAPRHLCLNCKSELGECSLSLAQYSLRNMSWSQAWGKSNGLYSQTQRKSLRHQYLPPRKINFLWILAKIRCTFFVEGETLSIEILWSPNQDLIRQGGQFGHRGSVWTILLSLVILLAKIKRFAWWMRSSFFSLYSSHYRMTVARYELQVLVETWWVRATNSISRSKVYSS
jgi:hypothetical protein